MSFLSRGLLTWTSCAVKGQSLARERVTAWAQGTFHPTWIPEAQMLIPDNLGEVERNEGWLHPLETPTPTPSLFPLPQNQSKFSLRRLAEENPFYFLPHWHHQSQVRSGKEQKWAQPTKHSFVSKTWETPTGYFLRIFSGTSAQLDLNLTLTLTSLSLLSNMLLDTFLVHSDSN